ncbi:MAG: dUTP diphosphatase [Coriobacteriales bacterium]|nr:dUTP diphosphatase [Coriobacteriales bacterium]
MSKINVQIKKVNENAIIPKYSRIGDAGLDLHSCEHKIIKAGCREAIHTGIAIALPDGYAGFVQPRSGLALRSGISLVNTPGLIDSNYRGELISILINTDKNQDFEVNIGDRIAQLVIQKVECANLIEFDFDENDTNRGVAGFGSSGIK